MGVRTWDGVTAPITAATAKLAKTAGCGLVTYKITGGYFASPMWGGAKVRRGPVHGGVVHIYTAEQLKTMTAQQLRDAINRDLYEDAYARQSDSQPDALGRDVWKDNREDIIFSHTDMVLNVTDAIPTDTIPKWIDAYLALHSNKGIFSMIIHEEYYYPDYIAYIPDCGERVLSAIRHVYEKGFRGAALEKLLLEREMA